MAAMIVGILACGTYYSPWTPYTLKSIYNICDKIVVVNGGYDMKKPDLSVYNVPLEKVSEDIRNIDVDGKIVEITGFTTADVKRGFKLGMQHEGQNRNDWYDMRGLNLTLANEKAVELGAHKILKVDSDQVLFDECKKLRWMNNAMLYQHEVSVDAFHLGTTQPSSPYNDSVFMYDAKPGQFYGGGGGPDISADRTECMLRCIHARRANPPGLTDDERFEHFNGRLWFSLLTNHGGTFEQLDEMAGHHASAALKKDTAGLPPFDPPECIKDRSWLTWRAA
jgi:hypothetical protein